MTEQHIHISQRSKKVSNIQSSVDIRITCPNCHKKTDLNGLLIYGKCIYCDYDYEEVQDATYSR